ncbi:hypothetical protein BGW38_004991 [Lunasporangiospora selenospora]|uniref:Uncharacterized protein n=1 Tax=Lunasporangiospora selenospora TaxID=979761 RepID=A0A9P6G0I3_9FUNG|nr:hypothetical protein BGW38_004991 [Lunasporangiospora selenospora]
MPKASTSTPASATAGNEPAQRRSSRLSGKVAASDKNSTSAERAGKKSSSVSGTIKAEEGKKRKADSYDDKAKSKVVKVEKVKESQPSKPEVSKDSSVASAEKSVKKEGAAKDIKLTIERCATVQEEVLPKTKSFEIYLSTGGSNSK